MQVWCTDGTRSASAIQTGQQQCRLIQISPSTMSSQTKVSLTCHAHRRPSLSAASMVQTSKSPNLCRAPHQLKTLCGCAADDCQRIFGAVRISKYVAQDNMEPITCSRRINHRAIAHYFDTYSPAVSRCVLLFPSVKHGVTILIYQLVLV